MSGTVETAIAAIAAAHLGITAAAGYNNTIKYTTRHYREPSGFAADQAPAIMVYRAIGGRSTIRAMDKEVYMMDLRIEISGFALGTGQTADQQALASLGENLIADIKNLQDKDPLYGTNPYAGIGIKGSWVTDDYNDANWFEEGVFVTVGLNVKLVYQKGNA